MLARVVSYVQRAGTEWTLACCFLGTLGDMRSSWGICPPELSLLCRVL